MALTMTIPNLGGLRRNYPVWKNGPQPEGFIKPLIPCYPASHVSTVRSTISNPWCVGTPTSLFDQVLPRTVAEATDHARSLPNYRCHHDASPAVVVLSEWRDSPGARHLFPPRQPVRTGSAQHRMIEHLYCWWDISHACYSLRGLGCGLLLGSCETMR